MQNGRSGDEAHALRTPFPNATAQATGEVMPFNIIDSIEAEVTSDTINYVAESSGETTSRTRTAMSAGIVAIVSGIIDRSSTHAGAARVLSAAESTNTTGELAAGLLGERTDHLVDGIGQSGGVNRRTAIVVMAAVLPLAAVVLRREIVSRSLSADSLAEVLQAQRGYLVHPTERDLRVISPRRTEPLVVSTAPRRNWLPLVAAAAAGVVLLGLIGFTCNGRKLTGPTSMNEHQVEAPIAQATDVPEPTMPPPAPTLPPPTTEPPAPAPPEEPVGTTTITSAEVAKTEAKTEATTEATTEAKTDTKTTNEIKEHLTGSGLLPERFPLKGVTFDSGSTTMTAGAKPAVDQLATVMKDNPSVRVRIEGNTDNLGPDDVNTPLSHQRAEALKSSLIDRGVAADRIETHGDSDSRPIATNETREGRADNRRTDVLVIER